VSDSETEFRQVDRIWFVGRRRARCSSGVSDEQNCRTLTVPGLVLI
jgi:hypothetical protein